MTIDIVLPFWGEPEKLVLAVQSVQSQTDPRWTLTVLDDAYPDEAVPRLFAAMTDERIRYHRNADNLGITGNFQAAVDAAEHQHLVVFGGDDLLLPDFVAAAHRAIARNPTAAIIQPRVEVIGDDGRPTQPLADRIKRLVAPPQRAGDRVMSGDELAASLLRGNWLYWPSLVFRRDAIQAHRFRPDLPIILDLAIILDIVFAGGALVVTSDRVFAYRRHAASASQTSLLDGSRFSDERRFYQEAAARAAAMGWRRAASAARWRLISRLHAVSELPRLLRHGSPAARRAAADHMLR